MFPFKQWTLSTLHPTQSYTHPICCIFVSSSGTISWCQACVVWSDSHALCRGVEARLDAQSTIALINTNSYARCSQVSINSQCGFFLGVVAFDNFAILLFPFSVYVRRGKEKYRLTQTAWETCRDRRALNMRTWFEVILYICLYSLLKALSLSVLVDCLIAFLMNCSFALLGWMKGWMMKFAWR